MIRVLGPDRDAEAASESESESEDHSESESGSHRRAGGPWHRPSCHPSHHGMMIIESLAS